MKVITLTILCLIGLTYGLERCYQCPEGDANDDKCGDPFSETGSKSVKCSELVYDQTRKLDSFRSLIVVKSNEDVQYGCAKAIVKNQTMTSYTRSCVPIVKEVQDACDLLKENLNQFSEVVHCSICTDKDNCNGSSNLHVSAVIFTFGIVFVYFFRN